MNRAKIFGILGFCVLAAPAGAPRSAMAQGGIPNCADLENPVYMAGTTAVIPVIRLMGARLKQVHVTLLWNENSEGCGSVYSLAYGSSAGQRTVFSQYTEDPPQSGKVYPTNCNAPLGKGADLVINDVAWTSCAAAYSANPSNPAPLPSTFSEFSGPVQGLVPIVANSFIQYNDIMVEELLDLYICLSNGNILTFTADQFIFDYNSMTSGMRELFARGLGLPNASEFVTGAGSIITAETMVTSSVAPAISPNQTIGYTSTEFYDQYRGSVRALKVRGVNQKLAYWPDSDVTKTDKLNIREGRYTLQGALRLVAAVDSNGVPTPEVAKHVIDWFQGNPVQDPTLQLPFDINEIYAARGVVPQCAMKVTKKQGDIPVFSHYRPTQPCHCSFQVLATGETDIPGCVACTGTDASACQDNQVCSHGYCEQIE
jgi:hypothetical protein